MRMCMYIYIYIYVHVHGSTQLSAIYLLAYACVKCHLCTHNDQALRAPVPAHTSHASFDTIAYLVSLAFGVYCLVIRGPLAHKTQSPRDQLANHAKQTSPPNCSTSTSERSLAHTHTHNVRSSSFVSNMYIERASRCRKEIKIDLTSAPKRHHKGLS